MLFIWQMKTLATARNSAVPSMLMLQPMGSTKRVIRGSMRSGPSIARNVTGRAAALESKGKMYLCLILNYNVHVKKNIIILKPLMM